MSVMPHTPLLDQITSPSDLKRLSDAQLGQLAAELRSETDSLRHAAQLGQILSLRHQF